MRSRRRRRQVALKTKKEALLRQKFEHMNWIHDNFDEVMEEIAPDALDYLTAQQVVKFFDKTELLHWIRQEGREEFLEFVKEHAGSDIEDPTEVYSEDRLMSWGEEMRTEIMEKDEADTSKIAAEMFEPQHIFEEKTLQEWATENPDKVLEERAKEYVSENYEVGDVFDHTTIEEWALDNGFLYVGKGGT